MSDEINMSFVDIPSDLSVEQITLLEANDYSKYDSNLIGNIDGM